MIERPSKFGGSIEFTSYIELEKEYRAGNLHPADLKAATATAMNTIIAPVREHFEKNKYVLSNNMDDYYYLFNTGYLFDISSNFQFFPSALVVFSPGENIIFDINAYFRVMDRFWFGASYRNNRSISAMFQFQLNDQIRFAYSYDFDFAELQKFSSGSHEVMLRYEFRYKVEAISPLNF